MAKAEATVEELVGMIERGERRLPEMQRSLPMPVSIISQWWVSHFKNAVVILASPKTY